MKNKRVISAFDFAVSAFCYELVAVLIHFDRNFAKLFEGFEVKVTCRDTIESKNKYPAEDIETQYVTITSRLWSKEDYIKVEFYKINNIWTPMGGGIYVGGPVWCMCFNCTQTKDSLKIEIIPNPKIPDHASDQFNKYNKENLVKNYERFVQRDKDGVELIYTAVRAM